jgi:CheY-like chemotaxis protein
LVTESEFTSNKKDILLVEDDEDILNLVKTLLELEGYIVRCAKNGEEALSSLHSNQNLPSLILLDLMMPVMDGTKFREEQIKNPRIAGVPVVIMSAANQIEAKSSQIGITAFLKKPLDIDCITETVKNILTPEFSIV